MNSEAQIMALFTMVEQIAIENEGMRVFARECWPYYQAAKGNHDLFDDALAKTISDPQVTGHVRQFFARHRAGIECDLELDVVQELKQKFPHRGNPK